MADYVAPQFEADAFNCPYCGAYAHQDWSAIRASTFNIRLDELNVSCCRRCAKRAIWHYETMMVPTSGSAPLPHPDMPEKVMAPYNEARSIVNLSPKGAAGLLRLSLQQLLGCLGEEGKDINSDIQSLVIKGLPVEIQQALDVLRVVGNNAVHPGQIDFEDSPEIAGSLFNLINFIVERMISQPRKVAELFDNLPEPSKAAIAKRDRREP